MSSSGPQPQDERPGGGTAQALETVLPTLTPASLTLQSAVATLGTFLEVGLHAERGPQFLRLISLLTHRVEPQLGPLLGVGTGQG